MYSHDNKQQEYSIFSMPPEASNLGSPSNAQFDSTNSDANVSHQTSQADFPESGINHGSDNEVVGNDLNSPQGHEGVRKYDLGWLNSLRVAELKDELRAMGCPVSGLKADLRIRLGKRMGLM